MRSKLDNNMFVRAFSIFTNLIYRSKVLFSEHQEEHNVYRSTVMHDFDLFNNLLSNTKYVFLRVEKGVYKLLYYDMQQDKYFNVKIDIKVLSTEENILIYKNEK